MTKAKETPSDATDSSASPDYEGLARQYLDLWQDQFAAMAADPGTMETMAKMTSAWREATLSFLQGAGPTGPFGDFMASHGSKGATDDGKTSEDEHGEGNTAPAGSKAPDGAFGRTDGDVDVLLRRIAELETRLAALERDADAKPKAGKKPAKKQSRRKPAKQS